jgi:hypothetical protein
MKKQVFAIFGAEVLQFSICLLNVSQMIPEVNQLWMMEKEILGSN